MSGEDSKTILLDKSIRYFVDPVPPNQFGLTQRSGVHVDLEWEHRQCYGHYSLTVISADTNRTEEVVSRPANFKDGGSFNAL